MPLRAGILGAGGRNISLKKSVPEMKQNGYPLIHQCIHQKRGMISRLWIACAELPRSFGVIHGIPWPPRPGIEVRQCGFTLVEGEGRGYEHISQKCTIGQVMLHFCTSRFRAICALLRVTRENLLFWPGYAFFWRPTYSVSDSSQAPIALTSP